MWFSEIENEVTQLQKWQAQGREAKLILFTDISNRRTWKDFFGNGRDGRWQMISLKLLWNEYGMGIGIYSKVIKVLQNEVLMVMCRRSHSPVQRRWKVRWKNKCQVINTHLRAHTAFFPSTITTFFFCSAVFILPWMFMGQWNLQLHMWEALSHSHFQIILDRGKSSEAGGKWVLNSPCSNSIALPFFMQRK